MSLFDDICEVRAVLEEHGGEAEQKAFDDIIDWMNTMERERDQFLTDRQTLLRAIKISEKPDMVWNPYLNEHGPITEKPGANDDN